MLSTTQAVAGLLLAAANTLAHEFAAAPVITPAPSCGENPCLEFVSAVPACATGCIESAASEVGCAHGDYGCNCASSADIQETAMSCVFGDCGLEAIKVIGAVGDMCECVAASPTTPCAEPTTSVEVTTSAAPVPTPTPACPGNECSFPDPAEHECVAACVEAVLPEFGCNGIEDWNCHCTNFRRITAGSFACANACGAGMYAAFSGPAGQGCTCLQAECEDESSSEEPETPTTITPTTTPEVTTTPAPDCPHPCAPSITAVPACATDCIVSAASEVGCGGDDYSCRCSSSAAIQDVAIGCVLGACGNEAIGVIGAVGDLCECVTASPTTACDGSTTSDPVITTTTADTTSDVCTDDEPEETSTCEEDSDDDEGPTTSGSPSSFVTETTKTVDVTTSVCEDDEEPTPTCTAGCGGEGGDGGDDSDGEDGGDGGDGEDSDDDDDDEDGGSGPTPSGGPGGDDGGDDGGNGGGSPTKDPGGGSTTTPTPPVVTAGASTVLVVGSGCLAGVIAALAAFL